MFSLLPIKTFKIFHRFSILTVEQNINADKKNEKLCIFFESFFLLDLYSLNVNIMMYKSLNCTQTHSGMMCACVQPICIQ